jgi:CBS-domain-containing membrane protein
MTATDKPLDDLCAADVMSRDLVLIPDDISLQDAARRLVRNQVSGAPVVDYRGVLVGVLSSSDFLRGSAQMQNAPGGGMSPCVYAEWQVVDVDQLPDESVHKRMTADPVTAQEDTPVSAIARLMVDAHIHRVIIVDEERMPKGIVTSTDILAAVARLADEVMPTGGREHVPA